MDKSYRLRIRVALALTLFGAIYYLVFLAYFCFGKPIEKIHRDLTDGWPFPLAQGVPLIAPVFLCAGLLLWLLHSINTRPKEERDRPYSFMFNEVTKPVKLIATPEAESTFMVVEETPNASPTTNTPI